MNSAIGVEHVNQDMIALATKATEIFIQDLTRKAYELSDATNLISYDDVQKLIHQEEIYDFLVEWVPKRIKFSDAMRKHEESKAKAEYDQKIYEQHLLEKQQEDQRKLEEAQRQLEEQQETQATEPEISFESKSL